MSVLSTLAAVLAAYLIGSLSFAVIISRVMGLSDPRSYGSGNPGATNVLRSGNKKAAILTLLFDALKGTVSVLLAAWLAPRFGWGEGTLALVGLGAFVGHLWPVFFRFEGGKGVATAIGVLLALVPTTALAVIGLWLLLAYTTRYSSLAAIVAAVAAPVIELMVGGVSSAVAPMAAMSALLVWRHEGNIRKLLAGTESKIGQKAAPAPAAPHEPHPSHHTRHTRKQPPQGKH
jgi:glycerol-3-phosphate acyltransferase PlsY